MQFMHALMLTRKSTEALLLISG